MSLGTLILIAIPGGTILTGGKREDQGHDTYPAMELCALARPVLTACASTRKFADTQAYRPLAPRKTDRSCAFFGMGASFSNGYR